MTNQISEKAPPEYSLLIPESEILIRADELVQQFLAEYSQGEIFALTVLSGAVEWQIDMERAFAKSDIHLARHFVRASSYQGKESGQIEFSQWLTPRETEQIANTTVMIFEDILDTRQTMHQVIAKLSSHNPKEIFVISMLDKPANAIPEFTLPENVRILSGFEVAASLFVLGRGLDNDQQYRGLRNIYGETEMMEKLNLLK